MSLLTGAFELHQNKFEGLTGFEDSRDIPKRAGTVKDVQAYGVILVIFEPSMPIPPIRPDWP